MKTPPSTPAPPRSIALRLALAALVAAGALPVAGQPIPASDFDVFGENTGCAGSSLCGDFGNSPAAAGDLNGDLVPDLAIGAPTVSGENPSTGRVYVFLGPIEPGLKVEDAHATITGLEFGDLVGTPRGGDFNGDGLGDLVIGARGPDIDGEILNGQVWIFYSPFAGDLSVADADATITGEGFSELGRSVAVGDFDGDGIDDVLAGASQSGSGTAHVFYGPIFGDLQGADADAILSGTLGFEEFGESVAAVDLNGDGVDDIVAGAPGFPIEPLTAGSVFAFYGPVFGSVSSLQADVTIAGEADNDEFGSHAAAGGDIDGDGNEDLLVGAWQLFKNDESGRAYVFYGPLAGELEAAQADAILVGEPEDGGDLFGILDGAGDVDGDGFDDVLVGAQFAGDGNRGRGYVFLGPLSGEIPAAEADWIFDAPGFDPFQGLDALGRGVGAAGDLDGNGFDDVLIGGPGSDGPGFARVVMAPGLEIDVTPPADPTLPPEGGDVVFEAVVTNTSLGARTTRTWFTAAAENGGFRVRRVPAASHLESTSQLSRQVALRIPAEAPPGEYTITASVGGIPHPVATATFTVVKLAAP